jgi:hypothetical protein
VSASAYAAFEVLIASFGPPAGVGRLGQDRPTHVDVRPDDIVRETEATAAERRRLVDLVREQRVVDLRVT